MLKKCDILNFDNLFENINLMQEHPQNYDLRQLKELRFNFKNMINMLNCQLEVLDYEININELKNSKEVKDEK